MTAPFKPWENQLQNTTQILRGQVLPTAGSVPGIPRSAPVLPPRPQSMSYLGGTNFGTGGYGSYSPYSSYGGYGSYGSYGGMGSMPYRSNMYGSYNSYGSGYGGYGMNNGYGFGGNIPANDAENRFIQFAEESSRNTFANVESIVRAFNSMAMMLDNTFFAMTSSFRAVLGVAENFGRLRSMFAHVWHALNIFRLMNWLYRKIMSSAGISVPGNSSAAWNEAASGAAAAIPDSASGSSWPTWAFFGVILSVPYLISKLLPKYEDKANPENWKSSGIPAKAAFDFASSSQNELSLHTNDEILLAPKAIQEEMKLTNSGWAYATCNGRSGVVPLNYIVVMKKVGRPFQPPLAKPQKRVSFGENQVFEAFEETSKSPINEAIKPPTESAKVTPIHDTPKLAPDKEEIKVTPVNEVINPSTSQLNLDSSIKQTDT